MRALAAIALAAVLLGPAPALAQEPTPPAAPSPEALHDEIRAMRDDILAAIDRGDFDAIVPHLHPSVVFTPMNNRVCRGPEEVRAYFNQMLKGPDAVLKSVQFHMEVDRLTDLHGDTGLAYGDSDSLYVLSNGTELHIPTRWTCGLVRDGGRWKIAAFHASPNAFDNPILDKVKRTLWWTAGSAGLVGLLLGVLIGRRRAG